jgi:hypothetical protein
MPRLHNLQMLIFGYIFESDRMSRYDLKKKLWKTSEFESDNDPQTSDKCTFYLAKISIN